MKLIKMIMFALIAVMSFSYSSAIASFDTNDTIYCGGDEDEDKS